VTDGVFAQSSDGCCAKFFPVRPITAADLATLTERVRRRGVRWFCMQRLLDADAAAAAAQPWRPAFFPGKQHVAPYKNDTFQLVFVFTFARYLVLGIKLAFSMT